MTAFEVEIIRIAAEEGVTAPVVVPRPSHRGGAGIGPSGKWIRIGRRVLAAPAPVQRWFAGHEMGHLVLRHGWADPGRWVGVAGCGALLGLLITAVASPESVQRMLSVPEAMVPGLVIVTFGVAFLAGSVGWACWSRRLEAQADRYAARQGRLADLDEASLMDLLGGDVDAPPLLRTHPAWMSRLQLTRQTLPGPYRQLALELDQAADRLAAVVGQKRRSTPELQVVRKVRGRRLARGDRGRTVVAVAALELDEEQRRPVLLRAVWRTRRLPTTVSKLLAVALVTVVGSAALVASATLPPTSSNACLVAGAAAAALVVLAVAEVSYAIRAHRVVVAVLRPRHLP